MGVHGSSSRVPGAQLSELMMWHHILDLMSAGLIDSKVSAIQPSHTPGIRYHDHTFVSATTSRNYTQLSVLGLTTAGRELFEVLPRLSKPAYVMAIERWLGSGWTMQST